MSPCSCPRRCCTSPRTPPRKRTAPMRCTSPSCWAPRSAAAGPLPTSTRPSWSAALVTAEVRRCSIVCCCGACKRPPGHVLKAQARPLAVCAAPLSHLVGWLLWVQGALAVVPGPPGRTGGPPEAVAEVAALIRTYGGQYLQHGQAHVALEYFIAAAVTAGQHSAHSYGREAAAAASLGRTSASRMALSACVYTALYHWEALARAARSGTGMSVVEPFQAAHVQLLRSVLTRAGVCRAGGGLGADFPQARDRMLTSCLRELLHSPAGMNLLLGNW